MRAIASVTGWRPVRLTGTDTMVRLWILPALLLLAGCPRPGVKNPDTRPLPAPEEARRLVEATSQTRTSLRALGRVTYFGEQGRVRLGFVEVVERPGRFRFETLSPLEQPIDVMTSDGERLSLLREGKLHEGPATPENVARLLPLPLRPHEIVDILLGGMPLASSFELDRLEWADEPEDHWRMWLKNATGERGEVIIDPARRVVVRATVLRPDGKPRLVVHFDDFEDVGGKGPFPREVRIEVPDGSLEVTLKLKEVELDVPLDASLFRLAPPPGVPVVPLPTPPVALP